MRIALIVPGGVDPSGELRVIPALLALIKRLARVHTLQVIALAQQPAPACWELLGARVHNIGRGCTRLRALRTLVRLHRQQRFDAVHAIWSGPCGLVAVAAGRLLGIASIVHVAGGELAALPAIGYGGALRWRGRLREWLVLRAATRVTSASDPALESIARYGVRAQRLPLGVDLEHWPPRAPVARDTRERARLIHVASLNRVKDQTTLLRALALLAQRGVDFEMTIVGEDTLGGEMHALAHTLGLGERVQFSGFLRQAQLRPEIARADLMMMASLHETGPVALLEAAVLGVPTVGTAVGHLCEWSPHAALAVAPGDAVALCDAAYTLLTDEPRRVALALQAQRRASAEDADFTARAALALYAQLARGATDAAPR